MRVGHRIREFADQAFVALLLEIERRADVQHARIDVTEHAVIEPARVEQSAELGDVVGQALGRNRRILDEGHGPALARHIAQEPDGALAHGPDAADLLFAVRQGVAEPVVRRFAVERGAKPVHRALDGGTILAHELDHVDAADRTRRIVREKGPNALPDDVLPREAQDLGIHGLDRGGPEGHQGAGVAQRRVETVVAQVDQNAVARDRQDLERRLGHDAERAFGAADHAIEVEAALPVADMGEVVAGQATVELGEPPRDRPAVLPRDAVDHAVDLPDEIVATLDGGECVVVEGVCEAQAVPSQSTVVSARTWSRVLP